MLRLSAGGGATVGLSWPWRRRRLKVANDGNKATVYKVRVSGRPRLGPAGGPFVHGEVSGAEFRGGGDRPARCPPPPGTEQGTDGGLTPAIVCGRRRDPPR